MKSSLTKLDITKELSNKKGYSLIYSKKLINDLIDILIISIKNNNLKIKNIGSFKLSKKNKRLGRNPKTGEEFVISSRLSVKFTASKNILNHINRLNG
tara:strand:- start:19 stop:312 length:294 start_codon:yes stop_codon:yes gene_type:complete